MNKFDLERFERQKKTRMKAIAIMIAIVTVALVMYFANPIRFDYVGGSHRIIPTAIDNDFWGNYVVYFKTSDFTQNKSDDHYYIAHGQTYLADQVNQAIIDGKELVVYYDPYMGWKGFTAPKTAPITKIEAVRNDIKVK